MVAIDADGAPVLSGPRIMANREGEEKILCMMWFEDAGHFLFLVQSIAKKWV